MSNIKYFLLFFCIIFSREIKSQPCYDLYHDANYLRQFVGYEMLTDSILNYEIQNETKNIYVYLLKARLEYSKGNSEMGFLNLLKSIKYGCDLDHHIFSRKYFKSVLTPKDSLKLVGEVLNLKEIPNKTANPLALEELYQLLNFDQALRYFTNSFKDSMCISEEKAIKYELFISRKLLRRYLEKFGYPDEKKFGDVLVNRFETVIIHHRKEIDSCYWLKYYYDIAYEEKTISPERYYNFYESFRRNVGELQITGTYQGRQRINNSWEIFPIENIKGVDSLREYLCLSPLHVFLKNNDFIIPEEYNFDFNNYLKVVRARLNARKEKSF